MKFQPRPTQIPGNYPSWASWNSREVHLPAEFHSKKSFNNILSIVKDYFEDSSVLDGKKVDPPLLLLGLAYREVCRSMEIEPDSTTTTPQQLIDSPFGIKEVQQIESLLDAVVLPPTTG